MSKAPKKQVDIPFTLDSSMFYYPEGSSNFYPGYPPFANDRVINGTQMWLKSVTNYGFCPFVNRLRRRLVVNNAEEPTPEGLLAHLEKCMEREDDASYVVVLPHIEIPDGKEFNVKGARKDEIFGSCLAELKRLAIARGLLSEPGDLSASAPGVLMTFHPKAVQNASWSPWPTLFFVKRTALEAARAAKDVQHLRETNAQGIEGLSDDNRLTLMADRFRCYVPFEVAPRNTTSP